MINLVITEAERLALELLAPVGEFPTPTKLESEAAALLRAQAAALLSIAALDPTKDSDEGYNEWGEADCFRKAQEIARAIVAPIKEHTNAPNN